MKNLVHYIIMDEEVSEETTRRFALIHVFITWVFLSGANLLTETMIMVMPPFWDWVNATKRRLLF